MEEGSIEQVGGLQFIDCCIPLRAFFLGSADSSIFLKKGRNNPIHPYDV
jgi:hypothetical protein